MAACVKPDDYDSRTCGTCRHRAASGACRCLSSTRCTARWRADAPACPWHCLVAEEQGLPAVHTERQRGERNYPRGLDERANWGFRIEGAPVLASRAVQKKLY